MFYYRITLLCTLFVFVQMICLPFMIILYKIICVPSMLHASWSFHASCFMTFMTFMKWFVYHILRFIVSPITSSFVTIRFTGTGLPSYRVYQHFMLPCLRFLFAHHRPSSIPNTLPSPTQCTPRHHISTVSFESPTWKQPPRSPPRVVWYILKRGTTKKTNQNQSAKKKTKQGEEASQYQK